MLRAVSVHSTCINCSDDADRRWSILTDERDFLPRSALVEALPKVSPGDEIILRTRESPVLFDPRRPDIMADAKWNALYADWAAYIFDDDLAAIAENFSETRLARLCGLGPGLTPAGDDFITGWLTAARYTNVEEHALSAERFKNEWRPESTTWFSRCMIEDATGGKIWSRGRNLLLALGNNDATGIYEAVTDILTWGHSSGRAWLAGFGGALVDTDT